MKKTRPILIRILKQALGLLLSLFLFSVLVFCLSRLAPGDPLASYFGDRINQMGPEEQAWAENRLGLNAPLPVQYLRWLQGALQGDFGISYKYKQDAAQVIFSRIGNTLALGGLGFVLTFGLALFLAVFCVWHQDRMVDRVICKVGTAGGCIPEFWLSLVLILVFSVQLRWLPSSGAYTVGGGGFWDRLRHLVLPLTVVVCSHLWYYAYMLRNRLAEEARADYVLLARAKGLNRAQVMVRHLLPSALPSYLSLMAISVPHILGGTYVAETVFSYPGLGALAYESARYQDYNLLMLLCLLTGGLVILCGAISRAISRRLDPRMKEGTQ